MSQGGGAVLYSSLISNPDVAIISSGHSILSEDKRWGGYGQIIGLPGYSDLSIKEYLISKIKNSKSKFIFSWGKKERGIYKVDAINQITANHLKNLDNFYPIIHDEGHIFPSKRINSILKQFPKFN